MLLHAAELPRAVCSCIEVYGQRVKHKPIGCYKTIVNFLQLMSFSSLDWITSCEVGLYNCADINYTMHIMCIS